jgi:hypothetical protein
MDKTANALVAIEAKRQSGILVALAPYTAGNLRPYLPLARILMPGFGEPRPTGLAPDCRSGQDAFITHYWPKQWLSGFGRSTAWGVGRAPARPTGACLPLARFCERSMLTAGSSLRMVRRGAAFAVWETMEPRRNAKALAEAIVAYINSASAAKTPFHHLEFAQVFPDDVYAEIVAAMPTAADYRPLPGRNKENIRADVVATRVKIDLFPEYIRHLPTEKQRVWDMVGRALRSRQVREAFARRLAPKLERRFGKGFAAVGMYAIPSLTRDIPGYSIRPHTDTSWKGITAQLYLPRDASATHIGTIFHERLPDGSLRKASQMKFAPNSGYAFAVGDDTWHSADPVGGEVATRDSILLTYFVDAGLLRILRNRAKRVGNFLQSEIKHLMRR